MKMGGGTGGLEIARTEKHTGSLTHCRSCPLHRNGDTRTSVTHPATTTHSKLTPEEKKLSGITDGLIRISVGLEHITDILQDIDQALSRSR
jgi:O-succinylhomoserine sulfhydrylase